MYLNIKKFPTDDITNFIQRLSLF